MTADAPHPGLMPPRRPQANPQDAHPTDHTNPGEKTAQEGAQGLKNRDVAELVDALNRQTARAVFDKYQVPPGLRRAFPVEDHLDGRGFLDVDGLEKAVVEAIAELDRLQPGPRQAHGPTVLDAVRHGWPMRSGAGGPYPTQPVTLETFLREKTQ